MKEPAFSLSISGGFSAQRPWYVNLINAPMGIEAGRPADHKIPLQVLRSLNLQKRKIFKRVLRRLKLKILSEKSIPKRLKTLRLEERDQHLHLHLQIGGFTEIGGQHDGLSLRLKLSNPDRNEPIWGTSSRTLPPVQEPEEALKLLEQAFQAALLESMAHFQIALKAEREAPRAQVELLFALEGLNSAQRKFVINSLLHCLYNLGAQARGLRKLSALGEQQSYELEYRLDEGGELKQLEGLLAQMKGAIGDHGKRRCSLWRSPMEGHRALFSLDRQKKQIRLAWRREK